MRLQWSLLLAIAALACGCDPVRMARGTVTTAAATCGVTGEVYGGGKPLADATLKLHCPEGEDRVFAHTGADGSFVFREVGIWWNPCSIVVDKPGFASQSFSIADICAYPNGDENCHALSLQAELAPAGR